MEPVFRKQLEIRHRKSYEMRGRLKQLGCEWDAAARAWIAPSLEVKELILEELDQVVAKDSINDTRYFGRCGFGDVDYDAVRRFELGLDPSHGALPELAPPIAHTPTIEEATKIAGGENIKRYWHDEIPSVGAELLASGRMDEVAIHEELREQGWNGRSVSLLLDIVNHFRQYPPTLALDEKLEHEAIVSQPTVKAEEMQGSIGVISDSEGIPALITITCPYDASIVRRIKVGNFGQKWNASKKRWEIPAQHAKEFMSRFPHFQRSPKAQELEDAQSR